MQGIIFHKICVAWIASLNVTSEHSGQSSGRLSLVELTIFPQEDTSKLKAWSYTTYVFPHIISFPYMIHKF